MEEAKFTCYRVKLEFKNKLRFQLFENVFAFCSRLDMPSEFSVLEIWASIHRGERWDWDMRAPLSCIGGYCISFVAKVGSFWHDCPALSIMRYPLLCYDVSKWVWTRCQSGASIILLNRPGSRIFRENNFYSFKFTRS